jgi:drug/metabolite transporter (DMT)-like permease
LSLTIFALVVLAAFLHASWNVGIKLNLDRFLALFLLQVLMGFMGLAMLAVFAWPASAALPFAVASGILHTGYNLFLARSYRSGDLSVVYPVARGTAPLIALTGTFFFSHDHISPAALVGIFTLIGGIWLIALGPTRNPGGSKQVDSKTLLFALGTSVFIGVYTIVDGLGARASGAASGYTGLVFALDGLGMLLAGLFLRGVQIFKTVLPFWRSGVLGAGASGIAYWIVIWAMSVAPIAMVAALRETSILFAIALSAKVLNEKLNTARIAGAILVVGGAMALRL